MKRISGMTIQVGRNGRAIDIEALFWLTAIVMLALSDPFGNIHFSLFLPSYLFGWESPGYNLGHAIAQAFHGEFAISFQSHPLGIPALLILLGRSGFLLHRSLRKKHSVTMENKNG